MKAHEPVVEVPKSFSSVKSQFFLLRTIDNGIAISPESTNQIKPTKKPAQKPSPDKQPSKGQMERGWEQQEYLMKMLKRTGPRMEPCGAVYRVPQTGPSLWVPPPATARL